MPNLRTEGGTASNHAVIAEQVLVIVFLFFFFFDIVEYNSVRDVEEIEELIIRGRRYCIQTELVYGNRRKYRLRDRQKVLITSCAKGSGGETSSRNCSPCIFWPFASRYR